MRPRSVRIRRKNANGNSAQIILVDGISGGELFDVAVVRVGDEDPGPPPPQIIPAIPRSATLGLQFYHHALRTVHPYEKFLNFYKVGEQLLGKEKHKYAENLRAMGIKEILGREITAETLHVLQNSYRVAIAHGEVEHAAAPFSEEDIERFREELPFVNELAQRIIRFCLP